MDVRLRFESVEPASFLVRGVDFLLDRAFAAAVDICFDVRTEFFFILDSFPVRSEAEQNNTSHFNTLHFGAAFPILIGFNLKVKGGEVQA